MRHSRLFSTRRSLDRRTFLKLSGAAAGGLAFSSTNAWSLDTIPSVAAAEPPEMRVLQPGDNSVYIADSCPVAPCTTPVPFEVAISAGVPVERIDVEIRESDSDASYLQVSLCEPGDPIEPGDPSCPTDLEFTLEDELLLAEGDWSITITVLDVDGKSASATVRVSVLSSSIPAPGETVLSRVEPNKAAPPILIKEAGDDPAQDPAIYSAGETVEIFGENLDNNPYLKVYLSPVGPSLDPVYDPAGGIPSGQWYKYEATIIDRGVKDGESFLQVVVPEVPTDTRWSSDPDSTATVPSFQTYWRWVIYDPWIRPERQYTWLALPDLYASLDERDDYFALGQPNYAKIHGFGFENEDDGASTLEFEAVYGNNAFICVGALGVCATRIPDPLYNGLWLPVYYIWINSSGGSCVGMSATSQLMHHELLQTEPYDERVHYPFGFKESGAGADWDDPGFTGPAEPVDLWATIRMNHGVQTSEEYVNHVIDQMQGGGFSINGSPTVRLNQLRSNPRGSVLCLAPGLGKGHCVTPYAVEGNRIWVYDNNHPGKTNRYVDVDPITNTFSFEKDSDETWTGTAMWTIPLEVWQESRSAPGLFAIPELLEFLQIFIFGDADGLVSTPDGGRWGWQQDGTVVDELPGAVAIPPAGPSENGTRNVPLILPMSTPAPNVQVNARGGDYLFHAAQDGHLLQLQVAGSVDGDSDAVDLEYQGNRLSAFSFTPQRAATSLSPKVGMVLGDRERALFGWSGLTVPGGGGVKFRALSDQRGVEFENHTGQSAEYVLTLETADGLSGTTAQVEFGPFTVPDGATHRATIENWPQSTSLVSEIDGDKTEEPGKTDPVDDEAALAAFQRTWARTDKPVADSVATRTWMWGPEPFTEALIEPYADAPGGQRTVQYFDKSRMEDNGYRGDAPWDVTNGLLVVELITGRMQTGDNVFEDHQPAQVNVAGDADDPTGPTYATFADLSFPTLRVDPDEGTVITERVDRDGTLTDDPGLAGQAVTKAHYDQDTGHHVASAFWAFMNSSGTVWSDGSYQQAALFPDPFYATGKPISEALWARVKVAGTYKDVLLQCFERRCLTYTPDNPAGWQVEAGNVGQHYYRWRYE